MDTPTLIPQAAQIAINESSAGAPLSASTAARYRQAKEGFEVAKEQAIRDLASNPNLQPQEMMDAMIRIQDMHKKIANFTEDIAQTANATITPNDASTMRQMRAAGATDAKIAEWYDTNPTKVNRTINGA
ncbi:hypothetical protein [Delftia acidovorans]|uniref:hypothetical protein n=1 Tax=Delftia acidovorans TaxID=80866 RepID=UPI00286FA71F|nr:hypothetical protein [Delftia acidovorans]